jgi:anti-sigma regulatory factor (Ser/Thr protein kinase)
MSGEPLQPFRHVGVLHRDRDELLELVSPVLVAGVTARHAVTVAVDPDCAESLRARLGPNAARVTFLPPAVMYAEPAQTLLHHRRRDAEAATSSGRPLIVLGQFQSWMATGDVALWEALFNPLLAGLPLTLMCACPRDQRAARVVEVTHPHLLSGTGDLPNPNYCPPDAVLAEYPPPAPPDRGPATTTLSFTEPAELAALRRIVGRHAERAGLPPDRAQDARVAITEIATNCLEHGAGHGRLLLWVGEDELVWEVHDPGRDERPPKLSARGLGFAAQQSGRIRGRGMWLARELSDQLHVWYPHSGTSVRGITQSPLARHRPRTAAQAT